MTRTSANFTLSNDGLDGPAEYIDERTPFIMSIIDGDHAGLAALIIANPSRDVMQTMVDLIELDYASWRNARTLATA